MASYYLVNFGRYCVKYFENTWNCHWYSCTCGTGTGSGTLTGG